MTANLCGGAPRSALRKWGTYGDTTGCQAFSPQGTTGNGADRENLVMQVTPHEGTETTHALCRAATAALAKVLDTAGLHRTAVALPHTLMW